jgi:hypothetical protein
MQLKASAQHNNAHPVHAHNTDKEKKLDKFFMHSKSTDNAKVFN